MLPRLDVTQSRAEGEIQPQWLAAQQRFGYAAVNIAKGVDTKFILYLERLEELNSSNGEEVQDFALSEAKTTRLVANFRLVFPFSKSHEV